MGDVKITRLQLIYAFAKMKVTFTKCYIYACKDFFPAFNLMR